MARLRALFAPQDESSGPGTSEDVPSDEIKAAELGQRVVAMAGIVVAREATRANCISVLTFMFRDPL